MLQRVELLQLVTLRTEHFYLAAVASHPRLHGFLHLGFFEDIGAWALRWTRGKGAKKAAGKAAGAAAGQAAKKGLVAFLEKAAAKLGLSAVLAALTGGTSLLAQAALQAVLWVGGKLIGGIVRGAGWLFSGQWLALFVRGPSGRWQDDMPLLVAAAVLLPILLLFVLPWFLNPNYLHKEARDSAFVQSFGGAFGEGANPPCDPLTDPTCAVAYCDPTQQNCAWPTACGCVTQGPFSGSGQTHRTLNAIDVGIASCGSHTDVHATHDGVVTEVVSSYNENQFDNTYGNYVRLRGTDSRGNTYDTIYAHLWVVAEYDNAGRLLQPGDRLSQGDPIGKTDNNGYSFGEHLHYEYRGGGNISTILPEPVPSCGYGACPSICW